MPVIEPKNTNFDDEKKKKNTIVFRAPNDPRIAALRVGETFFLLYSEIEY